MVDETSFVTVKHAVNTQGEELTRIAYLDHLLTLFIFKRVIHIIEVTQTTVVIVSAPHVSLFFCHDFTLVFNDKSTLLNFLLSNETPHF